MGWKTKLFVAFLGLLFLGTALWPLGITCFLYLVIPRGSKGQEGSKGGTRPKHGPPVRYIVGFVFILLAGVALSAGGTLSPFAFLAVGVALIAWPLLGPRVPVGRVNPVEDSVLLKSAYFPFAWHALAEVKPGVESFPRAASSFQGSLLVFTETGRCYISESCLALSRRGAEAKLFNKLRASGPRNLVGAYLLPLDSAPAADVFRLKLLPKKLPEEFHVTPASGTPGLLLLECHRGIVQKASLYEIDGPSAAASLPSGGSPPKTAPLVWEVLDAIGKRTSWPNPDSYSSFLDSLVATKGVPLGERLKNMEGIRGELTVQSLAGEELRISRSQMRAIVSVYS